MHVHAHERVLVVDDDSETRGLLASVLRGHGLSVEEAADGQEALDLLSTGSYAVILLDLLMPRLDGFAVLEALSKEDGQQPIVLVVTGADRRAIEQLDPRGIHGVVRKPIDVEELADVVVACTDIRGRNALGTMAIAAMVASSPLLAWLHRW
jgi:two-component system alkaline phosphatase synthesis response regulator PhoP